MHTTQIEADGEEFICHHNGDFSGDVKITVDPKRVEEGMTFQDMAEYMIVNIPFEVVKELMASWLRDEIVRKYEDIDADELFQQLIGTPQPLVIESLSDLQREMMERVIHDHR